MKSMVATGTPEPTRAALRRDPSHGVLGGVCAGLGEGLGVPPLAMRIGFLGTAFAGGLGVVVYGAAWAFVPSRSRGRARTRAAGVEVAIGAALLTLSMLLALRQLGLLLPDAVVWPCVLLIAGGALLWRPGSRSPESVSPRVAVPAAGAAPGGAGTSRAAVASGALRRGAVYRGGFGVALVLGAAILFLGYQGVLGPLRDVVLGIVVITVALALILAPFLWRLGRNLTRERSARIRSQERADVAAHLHDSVLQTLALVQKRADDPRAVAQLARRQERELRSWLWEAGRPSASESLAAALREVAVEVEEIHGVAIEVVTVGDAPVDERGGALVAAAREAMTNAAKFAGEAGPVDLFLEVEPERLTAFVRDRGAGFDVAGIPTDRRGVRDSILGRMARHGGRATIDAAPGGGTEVELTMDRGAR